ncbi:MAG: pyridoxamine 5'-phosphate oxidase family protein [Bryobacteraceae bacterium]
MDSNSVEAQRPRAARELVEQRGVGVLATVSSRLAGYPYASLTNYAVDDHGRPLFLFSTLAVHTSNLLQEPKASLLVFREEALQDPLSTARVNVMGTVHSVAGSEIDSARATYLLRHPSSAQYIDFGDFAIYRMTITDVYLIAGFGEMGWVAAADYVRAL